MVFRAMLFDILDKAPTVILNTKPVEESYIEEINGVPVRPFARSGMWWYFPDQEVEVDHLGRCLAFEYNAEVSTGLRFEVTRPFTQEDL